LLLAVQGGVQAVFDEPLADPLDRGDVDLDGLGDTGVGPSRAIGGGIGLEQDAGTGQLLGGRLAGGDQALQGVTPLGGQREGVLLGAS
jgi:hypothetical protein